LLSLCNLIRFTATSASYISIQDRTRPEYPSECTVEDVSDCSLQYNEKHFSQIATLVTTWARKMQNESDSISCKLEVYTEIYDINYQNFGLTFYNSVVIAVNKLFSHETKGM
jgi:hypothetical protein